jgi:hypothetical protein
VKAFSSGRAFFVGGGVEVREIREIREIREFSDDSLISLNSLLNFALLARS